MRYWLLKSEPESYSIDDMARDKTTTWHGVRNYQARNFMRDQMRVGDLAFFYHSNCDEPGIVGIVEVAAPAHPDETQFDRKSKYYDADATREAPRWVNVDVRFVKKTPLIALEQLRAHKPLAGMRILQRGNRLSITPVDPDEWKFINKLTARAA
jgi:predicted RNA-binding protein with PUA-like domain